MKKTVYFIVLTAIVHILSACSGSTVYDEYAHTPIAGWEKNDTLSFEVSPLLEPGHYRQSLGLRITGAYPFMGLTLIVEQTVYHRNRKIPGECKIDTSNDRVSFFSHPAIGVWAYSSYTVEPLQADRM